MDYEIEICCGSYEDALNAAKGKARRIELNSALHLGGLTPSLATLILARKNTDLKIIAMVRPRGAGFNYDESEFQVMLEDARLLLKNGADGIAFGFLDGSRNIDLQKTAQMADLIHLYSKEAVFHRAFDCVIDPYVAIEQLIDLGIDRILTSGQQDTAIKGASLIRDLQEKYGDQIEILAGSGVNDSNALDLISQTKINQIHSSCKGWKEDKTTTTDNISFAYNGEKGDNYEVVLADKVARLIASVCQ